MSTYTLSGTGVQTLTAGCTQLSISITTHSSRSTTGAANPSNYFQEGLLRFGNANGYYHALPVDAATQLVTVPNQSDRLGYALIGGAVISVVEVFNTTTPTVASNFVQENDIGIWSLCSLGVPMGFAGSPLTQAAAPGTTEIQLCPFRVFFPVTLQTVSWINGTTVGATLDVGIYDASLSRLGHTGAISQGSASAYTTQSFGPLTLQVGNYWMAVAANNTTGLINSTTLAINVKRPLGLRAATQATTLPTAVTLIAPTRANWPDVRFHADTIG